MRRFNFRRTGGDEAKFEQEWVEFDGPKPHYLVRQDGKIVALTGAPQDNTHSLGIETPTERNTMPTKREVTNIISSLEASLAEAQEQLRKLNHRTNSPGPGEYKLLVRYASSGKAYTYLVLITDAGAIYTTGTGADGHFRSWTAFLDWLGDKSPNYVGPLYPLTESINVPMENLKW